MTEIPSCLLIARHLLALGLILFSTLIYFAEQTEECFSTINCSWWDDDEARAKVRTSFCLITKRLTDAVSRLCCTLQAGVWYDDDTNLWFYDDESDAPYKRR